MELKIHSHYGHPVEVAPQKPNSPEEEWQGGEALKPTVATMQIILFPFCLCCQNHFVMPNSTPYISEKRRPVDVCVSDRPQIHQGLARKKEAPVRRRQQQCAPHDHLHHLLRHLLQPAYRPG